MKCDKSAVEGCLRALSWAAGSQAVVNPPFSHRVIISDGRAKKILSPMPRCSGEVVTTLALFGNDSKANVTIMFFCNKPTPPTRPYLPLLPLSLQDTPSLTYIVDCRSARAVSGVNRHASA